MLFHIMLFACALLASTDMLPNKFQPPSSSKLASLLFPVHRLCTLLPNLDPLDIVDPTVHIHRHDGPPLFSLCLFRSEGSDRTDTSIVHSQRSFHVFCMEDDWCQVQVTPLLALLATLLELGACTTAFLLVMHVNSDTRSRS